MRKSTGVLSKNTNLTQIPAKPTTMAVFLEKRQLLIGSNADVSLY